MKTLAELWVFTRKKHRATITLVGRRHQFFVQQRCIVPYRNANIATLFTGFYFPRLLFFIDDNTDSLKKNRLDIDEYIDIDKKNGRYTLNLMSMSRSDRFKHLFHREFAAIWDVDRAWKKYGIPDVIKFCVDYENDQFFTRFSILPNAARAGIKEEAVRDIFLNKLYAESIKPMAEILKALAKENNIVRQIKKELEESGKSETEVFEALAKNDIVMWQLKKKIWELDFSELVYKNPHNIYDAYCNFAYRIYTLLGFGIDILDLSIPHSTDEFLEAGEKLRDEIMKTEIPRMTKKEYKFQAEQYEKTNHCKPTYSNLNDDWMDDRSVFTEETLEQVPEDTSKYAPKEIDRFVGQLNSGISYFRKRNHNVYSKMPYEKTEIIDINNYMTRLRQYITDENDRKEFDRLQLEGTYFEKVVFLYIQTSKPLIREHFSEDQLERIEDWCMRQSILLSLDGQDTDDDEEYFSPYETIRVATILNPEEYLLMTGPFKHVFKKVLDEAKLDKFIECLPSHFKNYHPYHSKDAFDRFFHISGHYREELYITFFEHEGSKATAIPYEQFKDLIKKVEHIINKDNVPKNINMWISYFKNAFKNEFKNSKGEEDEDKLKEFIERLSKHLMDYPFEFDSNEKFVMEHNHKEGLYREYCETAGIEGDIVVKQYFNDTLIESVIEKIIENVAPDILRLWTDCFRIVFAGEINEPQLTEFVTFISDYFKDYPLKAHYYNGNVCIDSIRLKKIYEVYCQKKGIKKSEKAMHDFDSLVKNAFDRIDGLKNDSRSKS